MNEQPWDFGKGRVRSEDASNEQERAEQTLRDANVKYAQAEEAYRKSLALKMWDLRRSEGIAWSALADLARGDETVAALKRLRDDADGEREIAQHAVYRRGADRRDLERFIDWSARRDLAEGHGRVPEPGSEQMPVFGRRAA